MNTIKIPATLAEATEKLDGLGALLTAGKWERAAILAAYVEVDNLPGPKSAKSSRSLTPHEFAAKGIHGLHSKDTVKRYVAAWMGEVGERPTPGDTVKLPEAEFPTGTTTLDVVKGNRKAIAEAIRTDERVATAAADALAPAQVAAGVARRPDVQRAIARHPEADLAITEARYERERDRSAAEREHDLEPRLGDERVQREIDRLERIDAEREFPYSDISTAAGALYRLRRDWNPARAQGLDRDLAVSTRSTIRQMQETLMWLDEIVEQRLEALAATEEVKG